MNDIIVTFLGTGTSQGIPVISSDHPVGNSKDFRDKRLRSSVLLSWGTYNYVIDCGPDFRYQMLRADVRTLNGVLFTHEHADHVAGLDDLRPYSFQLGAVPVYGQKRVLETLAQRFDYIFNDDNKYPGAPSVKQHILENRPFQLSGKTIIPVLINHGDLKIFGYRVGCFAYLSDVKTVDETEKQKLQGLDVLVLSAIRHKTHRSHLNLEEALVLINELKPRICYLTHISQYLGFHEEVEKDLPPTVRLAYDGLVLKL